MEKLLFLDCETTGLYDDDRLCQVAYCAITEDQPATIEHSLFKPEVPMRHDASAVNHITDKMLVEQEVFKGSDYAEKLQILLNDDFILVAHNAAFDIKMLEREGIEVPRHICTMKLSKKMAETKKHQMQYLRYFHELEVDNSAVAHSAEGDVMVLTALFEHYNKLMSVDEMVGISES